MSGRHSTNIGASIPLNGESRWNWRPQSGHEEFRVIGYYKLVLVLLMMMAVLAVLARRQVREFLAEMRSRRFSVFSFAGYYFLYAWVTRSLAMRASCCRIIFRSSLPRQFSFSLSATTASSH